MKNISGLGMPVLVAVFCCGLQVARAQGAGNGTATPSASGAPANPGVNAKPAKIKTTPTPPPATGLTRQQVAEEVKYVLQEVSALRKLTLKKNVATSVFSREKRRDMLVARTRKVPQTAKSKAYELAWRQLDLIGPNESLARGYVESRSMALSGYYVPKRNHLYVADNTSVVSLRAVLAHELTHALQHQNFNILEMRRAAQKENDDATQALKALTEGDADWVEKQYVLANPWRRLAHNLEYLGTRFKIDVENSNSGAAPSQSSGANGKQSPKASIPPAFNYWAEYSAFPYREGIKFVEHIHEHYAPGSLDAIFEVLPPTTTEQILHPEKYDAQEVGYTVVAEDLAPYLKTGWKRIDSDVSGEFGLGMLLANTDPKPVRQRAAAGWNGDYTEIYSDGKKGVLVVVGTIWDSLYDAEEWHAAYIRRANARFGKKPVTRNGMQIWSNGQKGVWLKRQGYNVLILEGTVGAFQPERLMEVAGLG